MPDQRDLVAFELGVGIRYLTLVCEERPKLRGYGYPFSPENQEYVDRASRVLDHLDRSVDWTSLAKEYLAQST
jgi:hypothetical protein